MDAKTKEALDRLESKIDILRGVGKTGLTDKSYTVYPADGSVKLLTAGKYTFNIREGRLYKGTLAIAKLSALESVNFVRLDYDRDITVAVNIERNGFIRAPLALSPFPISLPDVEKIILNLTGDTKLNFYASFSPIPTPAVGIGVGLKEQIFDILTAIPLGGGGEFIQTPAYLVTGFGDVAVEIYSDVGSAVNGVKIQTSRDGTDFKTVYQSTYGGGEPIYSEVLSASSQYFRVKYTNGAAAQAGFFITALKKVLG